MMSGPLLLGSVIGFLVVLVGIIWAGLQVKPKPFPPYVGLLQETKWIDIPANLPAPVEAFYHKVYGDRLPVIHSAVISGRAHLRFMGISFPSRFRFVHRAGYDYRHYIETCFFGKMLLKVNEHFLGGKSRLELPFGTVENEPKVDQAANLGLWGEALWFPAVLVTDGRPRWEAIDAHSASLFVPWIDGEDHFKIHFDPQTGLIASSWALRWKETSHTAKTGWSMMALAWRRLELQSAGPSKGGQPAQPARAPADHIQNEALALAVSSVRWEDESSPWAVFEIEELVFNADVDDYVRSKGI
jgi:hypothetical protein